jgi:protein TonB
MGSEESRNSHARGTGDPRFDDDSDPPLDPYYQFLTAARPAQAPRPDHGVGGLTLSLMAHAAVLVLVVLVVGRTPASSPQEGRRAPSLPLVWTPLAGGGSHPGGGEPVREVARRAQLVGREAITLPVAAPPRLDSPKPAEAPEPAPRLELPAVPIESGLREVVGAVAELRPIESLTRGPGVGPGADGGRGSGVDGGEGDRLGEGNRRGRGVDGDGLTPGNGVTWPRLVQEVKPNYTPDAMRAQVEGMVELEILVLADGSVGRVNIVRSLDARFGLDQEAVNAVRRWRFDPGRQSGTAGPTRVGVELSFNLR